MIPSGRQERFVTAVDSPPERTPLGRQMPNLGKFAPKPHPKTLSDMAKRARVDGDQQLEILSSSQRKG